MFAASLTGKILDLTLDLTDACISTPYPFRAGLPGGWAF